MSIYDKVELRIVDLPSKIQLTSRQEREIKISYLDATNGKGRKLIIIVTPFAHREVAALVSKETIWEDTHTIYINKYSIRCKWDFLESVAHELAHLKYWSHDENWFNLYIRFLERFIRTMRRGE
jgi:hypothetical protein